MNHSEELKKTNKLYTNYPIGLFSMLIALLLPVILPILGSFIAPLLFIAGVVAVMISKVNIWLRLSTVLLIVGIVYVFWKEYESLILNYLPNPME